MATMKPVVTLWWCCLAVGVVLPAALLIVQTCVPDTLLATARAGQFTSATVSVGGYWKPTVTTVQTTDSTIAVNGRFSAIHGQPLVIDRRAKSGLSLCTRDGNNRVCAEVAGAWPGRLDPTGAQPPALDFLAGDALRGFAGFWAALGCIVSVLSGLGALAVSGRAADDDSDSASAR